MTAVRPLDLPQIGSADAAALIANHLIRLASGLTAASRFTMPQASAWSGPAAVAFGTALALQPRAFSDAAAACEAVGLAMSRHAAALAEARSLLDRVAAAHEIDPVAGRALAHRAATLASTSARQTASRVDLAAMAAPTRPNVLMRSLQKAAEWRAEIGLGSGEAVQALVALAVRFNQARLLRAPFDTAADAGATTAATAESVRHPRQALREITDWDTWTSNPARAVGHAIPDAFGAIATGGVAASTRAATVTARTRASVQRAAAADSVRRKSMQLSAAAARRRLVENALIRSHVGAPPRQAWKGEGGTALRPRDAAAADAYWRLNATTEPAVTAQITRLADEVGGLLAGLEHRLKQPESLKRKLATKQADKGLAIHELLDGAGDTVRYTLVLDDAAYVRGATHVATQLDRAGFHRLEVNNAWYSGRYRGINSTWVHPGSGTAFEVQFHTPMSWQVTRETHPMYEVMRLPDTPEPDQDRLSALIAAEYRRAPHPPGVSAVTDASFPPPTPAAPISVPPDLTVPSAVTGGVTTAGLGAADRRREPTDTQAQSGRAGRGQPVPGMAR